MEPIEEKLKKAMDRVDPPEGFAARVMARVEAQSAAASKSVTRPFSPWLAWWKYLTAHPVPAAAIALMIVIALGVGTMRFEHAQRQRQPPPSMSDQERMAGEKARDQMLLALKITSEQLSQMHALLSQQPPTGPGHGRLQ